MPGGRKAGEGASNGGGSGGDGAPQRAPGGAGNGGGEAGTAPQHRSYDEEKAAFMDDLLRGGTPRGGASGPEESRWLLDRAPPGAFSSPERTCRVSPLMVLSDFGPEAVLVWL